MTRLVVRPARGPLTGSVPVPSDKSISHRALDLRARCRRRAPSSASFSYGEDNVATLARVQGDGRLGRRRRATERSSVLGKGLDGLSAPAERARLRQLRHHDAPALRRARGAAVPEPPGRATLRFRAGRWGVSPSRFARGARVIEGAPHPRKSGRHHCAARDRPAAERHAARPRSNTSFRFRARRSRARSCCRVCSPRVRPSFPSR